MADGVSWSERRKIALGQLSSAVEFDARDLAVEQIGVLDAQVVPKKKLAALLPSRRGIRGSPSLQLSNADRFRNVPTVSGHLEMQSSAYELEDEPRLGHAAIKATNSDGSSSKVRSRWTSIRPHLSASHREADQAFDSKNYTRTSSSAGNLPSSSPLARDVFDSSFTAGPEAGKLRKSSLDFQHSDETQELRDIRLHASEIHQVLPKSIICSYLDATNEFSDIPMIEGALQIYDGRGDSQRNEALLRWKDISNKVDVRIFSIKTLIRGFSDISVVPEIKSSFFDLRKFGELYPKRIISVSGLGVAVNSSSGQAGVNSDRSFCLIFSSDQSCLDTLEMMTSFTFTTWVDAHDLSKKYSKIPSKSSHNREKENGKQLQKNYKSELVMEEPATVVEAAVSRARRATTIFNDQIGLNAESAKLHHMGVSDKLHHIGVTEVQSKSRLTVQDSANSPNPNALIWFFSIVKFFYQQVMTSPKKVVFSISNSHLWICIVLGCSVYSLLARDIWVVADGPVSGDPVVYGLLVLCFFVFCLQVVANFVVDIKHYQFSYKFWVDTLVILTTIFDVFFAGTTNYDLGCAAVALRANQCFVYFLKALQFAKIHTTIENDNALIASLVDLQNSRIKGDRFLQQRFPTGCTEQNLPYLEVLEVLEEKHMTLSQQILKIFNRRVTITTLVLIFIFQFERVIIKVQDYPDVFQLSSILLLTDLTPNRDIREMPAAILVGNTLDLYPETMNLCIEGICPLGSNTPKPPSVRANDLRLTELGESKNYLWLLNDGSVDEIRSIFNLITLVGIPIMVFWANVAFDRDIDRLVKNPLQELADRIQQFSADPFAKLDEIERQNEEKRIKDETYYIQRQHCNLLKALQSSVGPVGNFFLSQNLTQNDFSLAIQGKKIRIVSASVDIRSFNYLSGCLETDIFIYINKIAAYLHSFVASSSGCCFRNSGDQFSCAWRVADKTQGSKSLSEKEEDRKRKKEIKTSNTFDKALASMIKTLNSCHFDQELIEQALYCEPLMNQLPNFKLKLCFGFHYGSVIEGIIGSTFRFESCFASLNSDFQVTLQRACTYYQVGSLFSDKFVQSLSSITRNSFRLIDFVRVPGLREPFGIYTYDWMPNDPMTYAHVKSIKQFFDLNPPKYSIDDLSEYRKAVTEYVEGNWASAIDQFKSLSQRQFIDDGPCKTMIKFMEMFGSSAPDDWKGCSEIAMLDGIADIRDVYNLSY